MKMLRTMKSSPLVDGLLSSAPALMLLVLVPGCGDGGEADAHGNFEATEVTVSAEVGGRLVELRAEEGIPLDSGEVAAVVDTTTLVLQRRELSAQRQAARGRLEEARRQIEVLRAQLETTREEHERNLRLLESDAATPRQVNVSAGELRTLERRLDAARAQVDAVQDEIESMGARLEQVDQRIHDATVRNPTRGTVLTTYADAGEYVGIGQPLYDVASLDTLQLRAYVTGAQLSGIRLGEEVTVRWDAAADELGSRTGVVTWIASEAEFTPSRIQTPEERVSFVYAVEISVPNPGGALKIGMPGEVLFRGEAGGPAGPESAPGPEAESGVTGSRSEPDSGSGG